MPKVRDISWNYTTLTTGTTIAIPLPAYQQNDLLLAILTSDTAHGAWSCSGWTQLFTTSNTVTQTVLYKIASASESIPTFTATTAETYNGCIISIQDINTSNPFGASSLYSSTTQAAAAKFAMPTITTTVANSLLIYTVSNASAGVPSLLEGPVFGLLGADGTAESTGVGWGFKSSTGLTPSNVMCSNVVTGTCVKSIIQIAAPAGGATIIPEYCVSDASIYIDPLNGTTAFNSNTASAATADTNFGTSLGGQTTYDATVAAAADVGINSFHSCLRLTSYSGYNNLSGAELVLATANKPNATGKNILVHIGPSTEGQLQRCASVASGRGIWFGMRSASAVYKIWQVRGVENGSNRHMPVIINSDALNTVATSGTLTSSSIAAFGFWVSGTGITTTIWDFAALWMLDTSVIAGGNLTYPVGIAGMVNVLSNGKERRSIIQQGANQALILQPIQFGDGGTNTIYMDFDATAIEFPRQYNKATAEVFYNSIDNAVGITYYAGASDIINHRNSVISSMSKYHWKIHASSSISATYDFSGLQIIGAGTVQLKAGITFDGIVFSKCSEIPAVGATITSCDIGKTTGTNAMSVASPAEMNLISNCIFRNNTNAIKISTAGDYNFNNIKFVGNTKDINITATTGVVNINILNGGDSPSYTTAGATINIINSKTLLLTGLIPGTEIRVNRSSDLTELAGIESSGTSFSYVYTWTGVPEVVNIVIHNVQYDQIRFDNTELGANGVSIPIQQKLDRWYKNPA